LRNPEAASHPVWKHDGPIQDQSDVSLPSFHTHLPSVAMTIVMAMAIAIAMESKRKKFYTDTVERESDDSSLIY